jgi:AcrR family transcriptional regulator
MATEAVALDRRHRRRLETIEEVLDHAVDIMAEEGVAGLSLGEIARRMGIRPPSLYVYFPSKHALYDALFQRGWELVLDDMRTYDADETTTEGDLAEILTRFGQRFARWSVEHAAYAQLLFWRPVPGFHPSEQAYEPAVQTYELGRRRWQDLHERGLLRPDADVEMVHRQWTVVISGVISQQLSNAPDESFDRGSFTSQIPSLANMFAAHYANPRRSRAPKNAPSRRRGNAHKR